MVQCDHASGCAITGGTVYRGSNPNLHGLDFYADCCSGRIWTFDRARGRIVERTNELRPTDGSTIGSIVAISENGIGEPFVVDLAGEVFQILPPRIACGLGGEATLVLLGVGALRARRRPGATPPRSDLQA